jgi:hypothetical protein
LFKKLPESANGAGLSDMLNFHSENKSIIIGKFCSFFVICGERAGPMRREALMVLASPALRAEASRAA